MQLTLPLHKGARERPNGIAAVSGDRRIGFAELVARVRRVAGALQALGLKPGDRVGMKGLNTDRYLEFIYGTWWAGGVLNPVNIRWSAPEVAYSLDDCDTRILLVDEAFKALTPEDRALSTSLQTVIYVGGGEVPEGMLDYEQLLADATPADDAHRGGDDLAAVMYTGGTTGHPKGVMLSHTNMYINALSGLAAVPRMNESVVIQTAPMFHIAGLGLTLLSMHRLSKQVLLPMFEEVTMLEAIQRERGTETFMVPTMTKRLIEHPRFAEYDTSSLQLVLYGASPMDSALLKAAMKAIPRAGFAQAYGMTELAPTVTLLAPWDHVVGGEREKLLRSAGRPVPIAEIRIVDGEDREVPVGTVGEICARGPMVMLGYWNKPEQTAEALRGGWMHTGDGGRMDEDGYLYVVDRIKDMIVTGGENVYSAEVENAVLQMRQVSMCAVVGVPDEQWGERVHAVIVLRPGAALTLAELTAHCRERVANYKCPRSLEFRSELPLSAAGKLLKYQLRESYWAGRDRRVN
jgi:acyl-CoA synthetase (AMP-forming)/AMP-acid ligase II